MTFRLPVEFDEQKTHLRKLLGAELLVGIQEGAGTRHHVPVVFGHADLRIDSQFFEPRSQLGKRDSTTVVRVEAVEEELDAMRQIFRGVEVSKCGEEGVDGMHLGRTPVIFGLFP